MQNQIVMVSILNIIRNLLQLCKDGRTGTMYVITSQNDGAVFVLKGGDIVDVIFKSVRGTSALPKVRRIESGKFFFRSGRTAEVERATRVGRKLSFSHALFRMFNLDHELKAAARSSTRKMRGKILVVEDSNLARKILVRTLDQHGFQVVEAADGLSALAQLAAEGPDLVILDLILPDIDGYEVFSRMKEDAKTADTPVIILTSRASLVDKIRGKMSGTDEYLTKPFEAEDLLQTVEKYLV
ncbi:hypothetical protein MNBD_GAMMA26-1825 [hydrothermal vent metagenome]|uniref:Response regulatory domain-containing protein n=1 Tax=hydrothermal vent metagenome TaxID=652676 RepID=A0A3B1BHV4_9ZZZZ